MKKTEMWKKAAAVIFWLMIWQAAAILMKNSIVFVGPLEMLHSLWEQMSGNEFWLSVGNTVLKIMGGFLAAFILAVLAAGLAFRWNWFKILLEPLILLAKSVPVASFVVLLLILAGSENLSVFIVLLMVFPIIYVNMGQGLEHVDSKMLEMARVFGMNPWKQFLYIYRPAFLPFLISGSRVALGMSWKSGVAAEIIGVPAHSIGERLYMAKIYLNIDSLFAWTLVIILLSMAFEKLFLWGLKKSGGKVWKGEIRK
ncbi:MAG: ABC transporter permease subunit [Eubacteriales bacterium]|nr:ABC transporter permease subunit [Eubacteriales bacterium]